MAKSSTVEDVSVKAMGLFRIGYDNWFLVAFYVLLLGVFLFGILRPRRRSEWRSAGMAQGWVIALYAEMYGLPLTMYLVAWLTGRTEYVTDHFRGHAWAYLLGWGDAGAIVCDVIGQWLIAAGAVLGLVGWRQIYRGQGGLVLHRPLSAYPASPVCRVLPVPVGQQHQLADAPDLADVAGLVGGVLSAGQTGGSGCARPVR